LFANDFINRKPSGATDRGLNDGSSSVIRHKTSQIVITIT